MLSEDNIFIFLLLVLFGWGGCREGQGSSPQTRVTVPVCVWACAMLQAWIDYDKFWQVQVWIELNICVWHFYMYVMKGEINVELEVIKDW